MSTRIQIAKKICRTKMSDHDRDRLLQKLYGDWEECEQEDDDNYFFWDSEPYDVYRIETENNTTNKNGCVISNVITHFRGLDIDFDKLTF